MNSRILVTSGVMFLSSVASAKETKQPNVLFIMTDQQSYNMMSCMGNRFLATPTMDSLAKNGYSFTKCYAANPVSMPSRFSLLTGHHASDVGVRENTSAYDKQKTLDIATADGLGSLFSRAGYDTYYSGKTHLYGSRNAKEYGFGHFNSEDPYDAPSLYAEEFFAKRRLGDKPFLLLLSFMNPHDICYKAGMDPRFPDKLPADKTVMTKRLLEQKAAMSNELYRSQIPARATNLKPIEGEQHDMVSMSNRWRDWTDEQWNLYGWFYHRLTESVDAQIGRAIAALEGSPLKDNTIIVFTSDHGDMNGSHGLILKNVAFEGCERVPFIFVGEGIKKGVTDSTTLVCNGLDFIPTICDLTGIEYSDKLSGISLKSQLTGIGQADKRQYIVTEGYNYYQINDGRYKYTLYEIKGNPELLTDLVTDASEQRNFIDDKSYASVKNRLKNALMSNLKSRNLLPLSQNRTIEELRAAEKRMNPSKRSSDD